MTTTDEKKKNYLENDTVQQYKTRLDEVQSQKPAQYESQWQTQLEGTMDQILNREPFQYNVNEDALYQQYRDQYTRQGQLAMMDTMGQAAALTGGYGNSYAQSVGQQAYQGYLQKLSEVMPELYSQAYDRYTQQTQDLLNQYGLIADQEELGYQRYRDSLGDWQDEYDRLYGEYTAEREFDYNQYLDERNYDYQLGRDAVSDQQWQQSFDESQRQYNESMDYQKGRDEIEDQQWIDSFQYQKDRDAVSDSQWQTEFDEDKRRYDQEWAAANPETGSGSSGGSGSGSGGSGGDSGSEETGESAEITEKDVVQTIQTALSNGASVKEVEEYLNAAESAGYINQGRAEVIRNKYFPAMY